MTSFLLALALLAVSAAPTMIAARSKARLAQSRTRRFRPF